MTINYGKRGAGSLTAASPGDTLYIPYATYNDSGASINDTGIDVADVLIFKNGGVTPRATDSGVHIGDTGTAGDTGQYGNNIGLSRISIRLYNTTDDTGFFDAGSQYHVAIANGLTVDSREVNFFAAVFEIDGIRSAGPNVALPLVDVDAIDGDTGHADRVGRFGGVLGSDGQIDDGTLDVGAERAIAGAVWDESDTGHKVANTFGGHLSAADTGIPDAVWNISSRTLTSFLFDTGVADTVWKSASRTLTAFAFDTGIQQKLDRYDTGVRNAIAELDTGATGSLNRIIAKLDTGVAPSVWQESGSTYTDTGSLGSLLDSASTLDTGQMNRAVWNADASRTLTAFAFDTGIWGSNAARALTAFNHDTGVADTVWKAQNSAYTDTGSMGYGVNVHKVDNDTGKAAHLGQMADEYDTGRLPAEASATLDTGALHAAVWQVPSGNANRTLTNIDTGAAIHLAQLADEHDTGRLQAEATATLDTGAINNAIWNGNVSDHVGDTGQFGYAQGRLMAVKGDTGAAHLDAGRLGVTATASLDTGATKDAVWGTAPGTSTRLITALDVDTGLRQLINRMDTGISGTVDRIDNVDTGTRQLLTRLSTKLDTGTGPAVWATAARTLTAFGANFIDTGTYTGTASEMAHSDTGIKQALARIDTGVPSSVNKKLDTGVPAAIAAGAVASVTGAVGSVTTVSAGAIDTGSFTGTAAKANDTGALEASISAGVWSATSRALTSALDTGVLLAISQFDTGVNSRIDKLSGKVDTGLPPSVWVSANRTLTSFAFDTGIWGSNAARTLTSFLFDTGIADTVWKSSGSSYTDTGSLGSLLDSASTLDTGQMNRAVWNADASRTLTAWTFDTGVQAAIVRLSSKLDTGVPPSINTPLSAKLDTGVPPSVWAESGSTFTDTGSLGNILDSVDGDITALSNKLDTGVPASINTPLAAKMDTGVPASIDQTDTGLRNVILNKLDTGVPISVKSILDTGPVDANIVQVNATAVTGTGDTGTGDTWRPA
jgi:hypothetical protein